MVKRSLVLLLLLTAPASARGWRSASTEGACDITYARSLHRLDCAELNGAVEWQRQVVIQRIYSTYNRFPTTSNAPPTIGLPVAPSPFAR